MTTAAGGFGVFIPVIIVIMVIVVGFGFFTVMRRRSVPMSRVQQTTPGVIESALILHNWRRYAHTWNDEDPRGIHLTLRFSEDGQTVRRTMDWKSPPVLPKRVRDRIVRRLPMDRSTGVQLPDRDARREADEQARAGGYRLVLDPEIPVLVHRLDDGSYRWSEDRRR